MGLDVYTFGCMAVAFDGVNLLSIEEVPTIPEEEDTPVVTGVQKWGDIWFYRYSDLSVKKVVKWQ